MIHSCSRCSTNQQFEQLVVSTAISLGINEQLTANYKRQLFEESAGHPYVAKILLGEFAKNHRTRNVKRILATRKDILDVLFERTYAALSAAARRVFLTLCNWRSAIPQLALEAVLLRPEHEERIDVEEAVTELRQSSFIEVSSDDGNLFISVPLVAFQFGQGKLAVSPLNAAIQADTEILYLFGTTPSAEMKQGIKPRMKQMFDKVARRISPNREELNKYLPILEFTAKGWAPGWLLLASLYEELNSYEEAKEAIRRFLETTNAPERDKTLAWERLAGLCQKTEDWPAEVHARIELSKLPKTPFYVISNTANRLNELFREEYSLYDTQEKRIIAQTLVDTMAKRTKEGSANDFSRLAWLCLHLKDEERAKEFTLKGLELQPDNTYCQRLAEKLHIDA
jgi:tetratricopeptide (TPR) repeat protein